MKRVLWLLLLAGPYLYAESSISPPPVKETDKPVDLEREIRRLSESLLPSSGGDNLFYRDTKNQRIGIGTTTPSCTLEVEGTICATAFTGSSGSVVEVSTGIAFSVYNGSTQNLVSGTTTTISFGTEEYDTAGIVSGSTVTPNLSGYYQLNACVLMDAPGAAGTMYISINKNDSEYKRGSQFLLDGSIDESSCVSAVALANGSGDYFTVKLFHNTGGTEVTEPGAALVYFNGSRFP